MIGQKPCSSASFFFSPSYSLHADNSGLRKIEAKIVVFNYQFLNTRPQQGLSWHNHRNCRFLNTRPYKDSSLSNHSNAPKKWSSRFPDNSQDLSWVTFKISDSYRGSVEISAWVSVGVEVDLTTLQWMHTSTCPTHKWFQCIGNFYRFKMEPDPLFPLDE